MINDKFLLCKEKKSTCNKTKTKTKKKAQAHILNSGNKIS